MAQLPRRALGKTGLEVTTLGFGAMELRGPSRPQLPAPQTSDEQAGRLLNAVLDEGINFIDTAIDYGRSEELIGKFISHRRSEYILASKCGCVPDAPQGSDHIHTAENIRRGVEHSLRMLRTDYLDLVQFHRSLSREEFEADGALAEALALRDEGKVRFVGVSAVLPTLNEQIDMGVFDAFQIPYSAMQREHEDVIARASDAGMGIIIRGGVARGAPDDWQSRRYYMVSNDTMKDYWNNARLDELLDGMSRTSFLLRFTLSNHHLDTTIVGTSSVEHLYDNVAAATQGPLPDDVFNEAKDRLAAAGARPIPS
jgi:aryl-alcohol dehydrogenase-like predicted oxidoreductase